MDGGDVFESGFIAEELVVKVGRGDSIRGVGIWVQSALRRASTSWLAVKSRSIGRVRVVELISIILDCVPYR